jgi:hypothetical protein
MEDVNEIQDALRQHSEMLTLIAENQVQIKMQNSQIVLALAGLSTAITDFCDAIEFLKDKGEHDGRAQR